MYLTGVREVAGEVVKVYTAAIGAVNLLLGSMGYWNMMS